MCGFGVARRRAGSPFIVIARLGKAEAIQYKLLNHYINVFSRKDCQTGLLRCARNDGSGGQTGLLRSARNDAGGGQIGLLRSARNDAGGGQTGLLRCARNDAGGGQTGLLCSARNDENGGQIGLLRSARNDAGGRSELVDRDFLFSNIFYRINFCHF